MGCFSIEGDDFDLDKSRKCTDRFWLFAFILGWIILAVSAVWSFSNGNPTRIISGYDSFGNICGQKNRPIHGVPWSGMDTRDKPFVFHMDPFNLSYSMKVCVKECADRNFSNEADLRLFVSRKQSALFRYDLDPAESDVARFYRQMPSREILNNRIKDQERGFGPIPKFPITAQRPLLNRCVSKERIKLGGNSFINNLYQYMKTLEAPSKVISDIYTSWRNIVLLVGLGVAVSLVVVFTIHFLASIVSTLIMVVASLLLIAVTALSWYVYFDLRYKLHSIPSIEQLDDDIVNEKTFLGFSIILTFISLIILVITFVMRSRVALMVALFNETATCLRAMPALVIQPVWTTAVLLLFIAFWSTIMLGISTAENDIIYNSTATRFKLALPAREIIWDRQRTSFTWSDTANQWALESVKHEQPKFVRYLFWFLILMLFWASEFILGCQQMTVAAAVASYYFSRDKSKLSCPIGNSIRRIVSFHLGTIALGSLLMVLFKIPRLVLAWLEYHLKAAKDKYACVNCTLKCCHCCFYLLEKFMRFINHNAYCITAIEGTPYCFSARVAFETIATNTLRIATINSIGDFIIFLGKCIVTSSVALAGVYYIRFDQTVHYLAVPIVFASLIAYFIAHAMLSVYEMVIDTLFLCYVEDINKNATSAEGLYAPESLLEFARGDLELNKPGAPMIAQENNPISIQPRPMSGFNTNGGGAGGKAPIGFIYPTQVLESTH